MSLKVCSNCLRSCAQVERANLSMLSWPQASSPIPLTAKACSPCSWGSGRLCCSRNTTVRVRTGLRVGSCFATPPHLGCCSTAERGCDSGAAVLGSARHFDERLFEIISKHKETVFPRDLFGESVTILETRVRLQLEGNSDEEKKLLQVSLRVREQLKPAIFECWEGHSCPTAQHTSSSAVAPLEHRRRARPQSHSPDVRRNNFRCPRNSSKSRPCGVHLMRRRASRSKTRDVSGGRFKARQHPHEFPSVLRTQPQNCREFIMHDPPLHRALVQLLPYPMQLSC
eukprot:2679046-Prymnesium_polylepis.1